MAILTTKTREAAAQDAILANLNDTGGPTPCTLLIYTGSAPADIATGATGTLLVTCTHADGSVTAFGATNTTTLIATGNTSGGIWATGTIANTGTAGYWRIKDYAGTDVLQGSVGTSGADLNLSSLSLTSGATLNITANQITVSGSV